MPIQSPRKTPERSALMMELLAIAPPLSRGEIVARLNELPGPEVRKIHLHDWMSRSGDPLMADRSADHSADWKEEFARLRAIIPELTYAEIATILNDHFGERPVDAKTLSAWAQRLRLPPRRRANQPNQHMPAGDPPPDAETVDASPNVIREWGRANGVVPTPGCMPSEYLRMVNRERWRWQVPIFRLDKNGR